MGKWPVIEADLTDSGHQHAIRRLLDEYARGPMGQGGPLAAEVLDRLIPGLRADPNCVVLLAVDPDPSASAAVATGAVGLAICFVGFSTFAGRPLINIHDFAVTGARRGLGIGHAMLERVDAKARELGCCRITLEVRHDNDRAKGLYKRFGFADPASGQGDADLLFWVKSVRASGGVPDPSAAGNKSG